MFAIAYDLSVADADRNHPRGHRQAYIDIETTLAKHGFERVQRSVFAAKDEDLAKLFGAIHALRSMSWFGPSLTNLRAFRMEQGADFTAICKEMAG